MLADGALGSAQTSHSRSRNCVASRVSQGPCPHLGFRRAKPGCASPGLCPGLESLSVPTEHDQAGSPLWYKQGLVYLERISRDSRLCLSACLEIKVREVGQ